MSGGCFSQIREKKWNFAQSVSTGAMGAVGGVGATILFKPAEKLPVGWQAAILVISLVVFTGIHIWAEKNRVKASIKWGTAYYLGMLTSVMRDTHESDFRALKDGHFYQDTRALTTKLRRHDACGFDWVDDVARTADRMQESMNEDDMSTGFIILPNILAPAAMGLGSYLYFHHTVELVESPSPEELADMENKGIDGWPRWTIPDLQKMADSIGMAESIDFDESQVKDFSRNESVFSLSAEKVGKSNEDGVILVEMQRGNHIKFSITPPRMKVKYRYRMTAKDNTDEVRLIGDSQRKRIRQFINNKFFKKDQSEKSYKETDAEDFLRSCLTLLAAAERRFVDEEKENGAQLPIVLLMRLPKTLTLTLGQSLEFLNPSSDYKLKRYSSYWENLIIMNWEPRNTWRITRVHPAQKTLSQMCHELQQYGYSADSSMPHQH